MENNSIKVFKKSQISRTDVRHGIRRYKTTIRLADAPKLNPAIVVSTNNKDFTDQLAGAIMAYLKLLQKNEEFAEKLNKHAR